MMERIEQQSFQHIYMLYRGPLHRYLAKRTGNDCDAADLAQEAFMRLYEKNVHPETVKAWLYKTSYHLFVDHWRKGRRALHVPLDSVPDLPQQESGPYTGPESAAIGEELRHEIRLALEELKPRDRKVLLLLAQRGCSYREIAETIGCSENAVKTLVHRARKRMRELLEAR